MLLGHGDGSFDAAQVLDTGVTALSLRAADVNGDGFDDLLVAGTVSGNVALLPSLGAAGFAPPQHLSCGYALTVLPADFDGDGRLDFAVAAGGAPVFLNQQGGPFAALQGGTIGTHGVPWLSGSGALSGNDPARLSLGNARPGAAAALVLGETAAALPFAGGVLVPSLDIVLGGLATDATGSVALSGRWPAGLPSGLDVWCQMLVADRRRRPESRCRRRS